MIVALKLMDPALIRPEREPRAPASCGRVHLRVRTPSLRVPLAMMVVIGPSPSTSRSCCRCWRARRGTAPPRPTRRSPRRWASARCSARWPRARAGRCAPAARHVRRAFGVAELLVALAPTLAPQALALVPLGAASVTFAAGVNSSLQLESAPALRGRVMSLYAIVFLGSTPIGAPLIGWLAEVAGPRSGLFAGGAAALAAALYAHFAFAREGSYPAARVPSAPRRIPSTRSLLRRAE